MKDIAENITKEYNLCEDVDWMELTEVWENYSTTQKSILVGVVWVEMQKKDKSFWLLVITLVAGGVVLGLQNSPIAFALGLGVMLVLTVLLFSLR